MNQRLILEALEEIDDIDSDAEKLNADDQQLTDNEQINFEVSTITDLLNKHLDIYSTLTSLISQGDTDQNVSEKIKVILQSVSEDEAVIIGKLQQSLKEVSPEHIQDTMTVGEDAIADDISSVDDKEKTSEDEDTEEEETDKDDIEEPEDDTAKDKDDEE